jgi:hypothetical protein
MSTRRLALVLAGATAAVLVTMAAVSIATGVSQEPHEHYAPAADYAASLLANPGALRLVFGLDVGFLILYTAFFAALSGHLYALGRPFARLAFAAMVGTAVLDIVEDQHILMLLDLAERKQPLSEASIAFQQVLSSTKFSVSYIALFMYGLSVPRDTRIGLVLSLFLTIGTVINAIADYSIPPGSHAQFDNGRPIGFLIGFALAVLWLRQSRDATLEKS